MKQDKPERNLKIENKEQRKGLTLGGWHRYVSEVSSLYAEFAHNVYCTRVLGWGETQM